VGAAGGGYSGVRCVAEERRLRTLVRRLLDSDEVGVGLNFVSVDPDGSDDPDDPNRLDSRRLDFFLSPNMAKRSGPRLRGSGGARVGVS
jgi:hypothetical protein